MNRRKVSILLVSVIVLAIAGFACLLVSPRLPSDQSAVEQFRLVKPHLEQLTQMLSDDPSVERVADYGVVTDKSVIAVPPQKAGMTMERYQEFLKYLELAGAKSAAHRDNEFKFGIVGRGFASGGWRLAYVYRNSPPAPPEIIRTIDGFRPPGKGWEQGYRHLEGNWYIWIIW
jgi:hypothetical protein